jgi:hypothetical protein
VNGEELKSTIAEAALISPRIHEEMRSSPEFGTFHIDDTKLTLKDFGRFLTFVHSEAMTDFSESERTSFLSISGLLGNTRLTFLLLESLHVNEATESNDGLNNRAIDADVCASKFYEYSNELIERIDKGMLHEILKSRKLKLENEDRFLTTLIDLGSDYFDFWEYIELKNLTKDGLSRFFENLPFDELRESIWNRIVNHMRVSTDGDMTGERYRQVICFESLIVTDYPTILSEFANKTWKLLYRGSRDGFRSSNFHEKCDGQSNTLTLIETTKGFIFGGFTPLVWDSTTNTYKSDSSRTSFLFTLKNSRNIEPRKFTLSNASNAIYSYSGYGPCFGYGVDICVANNCNASKRDWSTLGNAYVNDTGIDGRSVFTGEYNFTVKEIEVFALTL